MSRRLSETWARAALDALPAQVAVLDRDGVIVAVNAAWERVAADAGCGADRPGVGADYLAVFRAAGELPGAAETLAGLQAVLDGRQPLFTIESGNAPDNKRWVHLTATPLNEADGGAAVTLVDVTERKLAEARLQRSERLFHAIFDVSPFAIAIVSFEEGRFLDANPSFEQGTGYTREELIGRTGLAAQLWATGPEARERAITAVLAGRPPRDEPGRLRTKSGELRDTIYSMDVVELDGRPCLVAMYSDVTERRRGEEERARLAAIVEASGDAIIGRTPEGVITSWNRGAERLYGYTAAEAIGRQIAMLFPPGREDEAADLRRRLLAGESVEQYETERLAKGDRLVQVAITLSPVVDKTGQVVGISKIARDITQRKDAETALRAAEARFRALVEQIPAVTYVVEVDAAGDARLVYASPQFASLLGVGDIEWTADRQTWQRALHPEDRARVLTANERSLTSDEAFRLEYRLLALDGRVVWVRDEAVVVEVEPDGRRRWLGVMLDVSDAKEAEQALAHERDLLHALLDNLPHLIFFKDVAGRFIRVNRALARLWGIPDSAEAVGRTDAEFLPPAIVAGIVDDDRHIFGTGEAVVGRVEPIVDETGAGRWLLTTKTPFRDGQGRITGLVGIAHDITERKAMEEELRRAKEAAEATSRLKSEFLSTVTHELRTPTTAVQGYLDLLLEAAAGPLSPAQSEFVKVARRNTRRLTTMIDAVLDLARIEAGQLELRVRPVSLTEAVARAWTTVAPLAATKGLTLEAVVPESLPPVAVDPERMQQVLVELVSNAVKFTERGGITIRASTANGFAEIEIADTGIGIEPAALPYVFEAFRQADGSETRRYGGLGLGLAIAHKLIALQGGVLTAQSDPGAGSSFLLRLPLVAAPET